MKILMLGTSGVGKTSYMVTTYGLMQQNIEGFTLKAKDNERHNYFMRLFSYLKDHNRYPAATDKFSTYKFDLLYNGEEVLEFEWVDFHGGLLDCFDDDSNVKKLQAAIAESDAILLFLESQRLLANELEQQNLSTLLYYLFHYASTNDKKLTVIPMFTKFDILLDRGIKEDDYQKLKAPIVHLEEMAKENENLTVASIPIACARSCMMHIDLIILYLMREGIDKSYISESKDIKLQFDLAQRTWNEGTSIGHFLGTLFDVESKRGEAINIYNNAKARAEKLDKMEKAFDRINEFIGNYKMFEYYSFKLPNESSGSDIFDF